MPSQDEGGGSTRSLNRKAVKDATGSLNRKAVKDATGKSDNPLQHA